MGNRGRLVEPIFRNGFMFMCVSLFATVVLGQLLILCEALLPRVVLGTLLVLVLPLALAIGYAISGRWMVASLRDLGEHVIVTTGCIRGFPSNLDGDKDFIELEPGGQFWIRASDTRGWAREGMCVHVWHYPRSRVATAVINADAGQ